MKNFARLVFSVLLISVLAGFMGCDTTKQQQSTRESVKDSPCTTRYVPVGNNPEIALDTQTGVLCRTVPEASENKSSDRYANLGSCGSGMLIESFEEWKKKQAGKITVMRDANGRIAEVDSTPDVPRSWIGARKAYRGFTYTFDGSRWKKGGRAREYNTGSGTLEPSSDDQYDPLNLFSKDEKAKHTVTEEQIQQVATQFGVSYEEAWQDAKDKGYQVPPRQH